MRELHWDTPRPEGSWLNVSESLEHTHTMVTRFLSEQADARLEANSPLQFDWHTIVAMLVTIVGSALATSAGIGGGALFVPMFHVLVGFGLKTSTALSQTVITGGSLASVVLNAFKSNPADPSRPLIDYRLVLVFTPVLLLGVNTGVLLNTMFPEWLITVFLVTLILYLVISSFKKGRQLWKLEQEYTLIAASHPEHQPMAILPEQQYKELPEDDNTSIRFRKAADDASVCDAAVFGEEAGGEGGENGGSVRGGRAMKGQGQNAGGSRTVPPHILEPLVQPDAGKAHEDIIRKLTSDLSDPPTPLSPPSAETDMLNPLATIITTAAATTTTAAAPAQQTRFRGLAGGARGGAGPRRSLECQLAAGDAPHAWRPPTWLKRSAFQTGELVLLWGGFSAVQVFKTQTELCSRGFWYFYGAQVCLMLAASVGATWQGMKLQQRQLAHPGHMVVVMDGVRRVASQPSGAVLQFTWKMIIISQIITLIAGITGGLLGIGGGMVMSPLLLQMGVEPQVSAATTSLMVLFSSSTAVVQFAIMGRLNQAYALLFSGVSLVASMAGVMVVGNYVRRSGKTSVIVIILAVVVSVGGLVTGVIGIKSAVQDFSSGTGIGFHDLCRD